MSAALALALAVFFLLLSVVFPFGLISAGAGALLALVFLVAWLLTRSDFVECSVRGLRTRRYGRTRFCAWSDVEKIAAHSHTGRAQTTSLVHLQTRSGKLFTLGAPMDRGEYHPAEFTSEVAQIQEYWRKVSSPGTL